MQRIYRSIQCRGSIRCTCDGECHSVTRDYPKLNTQGKLLVRKEEVDSTKLNGIKHTFIVFPTYDDFKESIKDETNKCYHEIILGHLPQKLKIDIDLPADYKGNEYNLIKEISRTAKYIFNNMYYDQLCDHYLISNSKDSKNPEVCTTISSGLTNEGITKTGFHIIIKHYMVKNYCEAREFTRRLMNMLPNEYREVIDSGVNKSIQSFRLIGCHKIGQPQRIKKLLNNIIDEEIDSVITQSNDTKVILGLPSQSTNQLPVQVIPTGNYEKIILKCAALLTEDEQKSHVFKEVFCKQDRTYISYTRILSSYCNICKRVHDKDNTLVFGVNPKGIPFKMCRHYVKQNK